MVAAIEVKKIDKLKDGELLEYARLLKLDSTGTSRAVFDRIVRHLRTIQPQYSPSTFTRKKRSKKIKARCEVVVSHTSDEGQDVTVELVSEELQVGNLKEFELVFEKFEESSRRRLDDDEQDIEMVEEEDDEEDLIEDRDSVLATKKKLRKLGRYTVAQLKQMVSKPEWVDVTADDPILLVQLKSARNTVPVPNHWSVKRKYLQGKRGMAKAPFELPEYIKATGIMQLRQVGSGAQSLQGKMRERYHPKLGRMDIDYQKLHDAFFKYQTKPPLSAHGDIYYEGTIRINYWYGPPPSYPQLKISGLNAPIPIGAQWGFHPGGWGKPPTDEYNRPLYGDVFGIQTPAVASKYVADIEPDLWGELDAEEEVEDDDEEAEADDDDDDDEMDEEADQNEQESGMETPAISISGLETPAAPITSFSNVVETPDHIELRKRPSSGVTKPLYQVLTQKNESIDGFMGSSHSYQMPTSRDASGMVSKAVDVAFNPEELDGMDAETLKRKYEAGVEAKDVAVREDFSELVAEHADKQSKKGKKEESGKSKRQKEYKF